MLWILEKINKVTKSVPTVFYYCELPLQGYGNVENTKTSATSHVYGFDDFAGGAGDFYHQDKLST